MKNIKISVITATFNLIKNGREGFFRQMVESVQRQTWRNVEHLIVDGGSSDGTVQMLEELASAGKIRYISELDKGIYDAMNKGAALAAGELITFLNSDDFFSNTKGLEESMKVFDKGFDYSYAPITVLNEENGKTEPGRIKWLWLLRNMPFPHPGMLVRKQVFEQLGGFDSSLKLVGDYDFILRLLLAGYRGAEADPFVTFRAGGATDVYADKHKSEMARVYVKNYAGLAELSEDDCRKIAETYIFPPRLLKVLRSGRYQPRVRVSAWWTGLNSWKRRLKNKAGKK